jgi:hypothetical protein
MPGARSVAFFACLALAGAACSSSTIEVAVPATTLTAPGIPVTTARAEPVALPAATVTAVEPPAPTTSVDPSASVLAGYDTYWTAYLRLMQEPDPASPALAGLMTGRQRELVSGLVQQRLEQNQRLRFPAASIARRTRIVESITGTRAVVVVCAVDDSYLIDVGSGAISLDEVQTVLSRVSVVQEDGVWKVERVLIDRTWDGVAGCAA